MKQLTGNDAFNVRQLYGTQFTIDPKAAFFMCCNDVPPTENCDGGMARRIRIIPLEQKFVNNPVKAYEQAIDVDLDRKIEGWGAAFMYILYFYRLMYPHPIVEECPYVLRYTADIAQETDHFLKFDNERLSALTPQEVAAGRHTAFADIWELYETFCGVHKIKPVPMHSLRRRVHEKYGTEQVDGV